MADLLRNDGARRRLDPREDRLLRSLVDRRGLVAAFAGADDRLALGARRQPLEDGVDVRDRRPAELQPVSQFPLPAPAEPARSLLVGSVEPTPSGSISRPEVSFG